MGEKLQTVGSEPHSRTTPMGPVLHSGKEPCAECETEWGTGFLKNTQLIQSVAGWPVFWYSRTIPRCQEEEHQNQTHREAGTECHGSS